VHFQQSQRALDVMRCTLPEERRCSRIHLPIRALAIFPELSAPQAALLRDMNMLGAFFYCAHKPNLGDSVRLDFAIPVMGHRKTVTCEGRVVRLDEAAQGAAIGVAVQFTRCQLASPKKMEQPRPLRDYQPFIAWTVEMVERTIEKNAKRQQHRTRSNVA
jgi:PilZ domain-containing protein